MAINQQLITLKYIHLITWEWADCLFWILNEEQGFEVAWGNFSKPLQTVPVTSGPIPQYCTNGLVALSFPHGKDYHFQFYFSDAKEQQSWIAVIVCSMLYK